LIEFNIGDIAPFADLGDFHQGLVEGLLQGEEIRLPGLRDQKREEGQVFMGLGRAERIASILGKKSGQD